LLQELTDAFRNDRPTLFAALRERAPVLAAATDCATFERAAVDVEATIEDFRLRHIAIQDVPEVAAFLLELDRVRSAVRRARVVWRAELNEAARLQYFEAQRALPVSERGPDAHPIVIDANVAETRGTRARNARDRAELVPLAQAELAAFVNEGAAAPK
jgi:hypothetical protein